MEREKALELMKTHVKTKNLQKHMLAAEAVMKALAHRFGEDDKLWALAGLLHDIDYDQTKDDTEKHGLVSAEILRQEGLDESLVHAVLAHCGKVEAESLFDRALYCTDPITGFIVACALIHPEKKLSVIDVPFILGRFKEKRFAAGASREIMATCSSIGLELDQFSEIALKSMQDIHEDIGL